MVRVPDASVYIRPEVGGLMLGGFEARPKAFSMAELPPTFEIEHTEKDLGVLEELAGGLTRAFPALAGAPVLKGCAGLPTFTPDGNYLLGAGPDHPRSLGRRGLQRHRDRGVAPRRGVAERAGHGGRTRDDTASQALTGSARATRSAGDCARTASRSTGTSTAWTGARSDVGLVTHAV